MESIAMKVTTIYAAQILGYLTAKEEPLATAKEIVAQVGVTYQYCMKILNEMRHAGLLVSEQGCRGGFRLGKAAEKISLYDVVSLFERDYAKLHGRDFLPDDSFSRVMDYILEIEAEKMKHLTIREIYSCDQCRLKMLVESCGQEI